MFKGENREVYGLVSFTCDHGHIFFVRQADLKIPPATLSAMQLSKNNAGDARSAGIREIEEGGGKPALASPASERSQLRISGDLSGQLCLGDANSG